MSLELVTLMLYTLVSLTFAIVSLVYVYIMVKGKEF